MENVTEPGDNTFLIDFNSPVSKRVLHTPLIPVPTVNNLSVSPPTNTNPFDIAVKQTISPESFENDPFECASQKTFISVNNCTEKRLFENKQKCQTINSCKEIKSETLNGTVNSSIEREALNEEHKENCDMTFLNLSRSTVEKRCPSNKKDNDIVKSYKMNEPLKNVTDNINNEREKMNEKNKDSIDNRLLVEFERSSNLLEISTVDRGVSTVENKANALLSHSDDVAQVSGDFSTEEGIKATIAKRVNNCIQKVLNNSMIKSKNYIVKTVKKSSSFTTSSTTNKVCDRLNKSCSEPAPTDDSFIVMNHDLKTPDSSIGSSDVASLSFMYEENLKDNESVFLTTEMDEVFKEANKLARTFSKISESFSKDTGDADNDEDLFTCKPQFLYADSSEDEEEKLRRDPALNFRVSFTNSMTHDQPDSVALSAFKTRVKSSSQLQNNNSQNEVSFKRSLSIGSKQLVAPIISTIVSTSVPTILERNDDNLLKLRKKPMNEVRKGPMRAVMPVQNMAKESLTSCAQLSQNRATSPVRKKNSSLIMISPIKDVSQLSMHPVASSTPNKCSAVAPHIVVPKNKRHSLESTTDNRKSRPPVVESGSRQRSSSASSCIPAPVSQAVRGLGPKSISNLMRNSSTARANAHQGEESGKLMKQTKPTFNSKALNEVKPKIVRPSRVKSTVNAISNIITGKSKKSALRDKENRFPA